MARVTGKTIYLLGAGASQHTGAPLLKDFLLSARVLREEGGELRYQQSFDRVFKWIDSLRASSYYVEFDLDNLEHVFSLAEMSRQLGLESGEERCSDLRYVIMETLDRLQLRYTRGQLVPSPAYGAFVSKMVALNNARLEHVGATKYPLGRDVIITFNYDVMLDYAMKFHGIRPSYGVESGSSGDSFQVLKLHGSSNLARCRSCGGRCQLLPPDPIPPGHTLPFPMDEGHTLEFRMVTNVLPNTECVNCKQKGSLEPVIIPPTWSKEIQNTPLVNVWKAAVQAIGGAFQVVVIGYSMPPTDTFFQYLLTLGLQSNPGFHRVVIVNRDPSEQLMDRYRRTFSRSLADRGHLKFLCVTFEQFIGEHMEAAGSQIEWNIK